LLLSSGKRYIFSNKVFIALRLYPVLPGLNRVALRDTVLPVGGGADGKSPVFCAAGTHFNTSFYVIHHQAKIYGPDVEEFKPERWDTFQPKSWEYVPFAQGPRMCPGHHKATLEASYVVARIMQEFEKIESRDSRPWAGQVRLTSRNANGCLVSFAPAR
jgi:cytochrome P450